MTTNTPECTFISDVDYARMTRPKPRWEIALDQWGFWSAIDTWGRFRPQQFRQKGNLDHFITAVEFEEAGDLENAGKHHTWASNGEASLRRGW